MAATATPTAAAGGAAFADEDAEEASVSPALEAAANVNSTAGTPHQQQQQSEQQEQEIAKAEEMERQRLIASEPLPTSKRGFFDSPKFALRSLLRQREWLPPKCQSVGVFDGEPVFLRRDVIPLKTARQWRREFREVKPEATPVKMIKVGTVLKRYPHLLRQQQQRQQQQQAALQQMWAHRRLAVTAKNPCLRMALQQQQQQQQPQPKQTQEVGLFAEHQTQPMKRETVFEGRLPVGPQGTVEVGELRPVPLGAVHLSVSKWMQEHPRSALSVASLGQALQAAATESLGAPEGLAWAPAVVGFEREVTGAWRALRDGIVVVETAAAAVTARWQQLTDEREAAAAKRRDRLKREQLQTAYSKWRALFKAILYASGYSQQQQQQHQQQQLLQRAAAPDASRIAASPDGTAMQGALTERRADVSNPEALWETI
ncbi:hypothetical protein Emag_003541 [Eimeria magna]